MNKRREIMLYFTKTKMLDAKYPKNSLQKRAPASTIYNLPTIPVGSRKELNLPGRLAGSVCFLICWVVLLGSEGWAGWWFSSSLAHIGMLAESVLWMSSCDRSRVSLKNPRLIIEPSLLLTSAPLDSVPTQAWNNRNMLFKSQTTGKFFDKHKNVNSKWLSI